MAEHVFTTQQLIARPRPEVFDFFSKAENLERITPPELSFHIVTPVAVKIEKGCLIDYRLSLHGIPMKWQSSITVWDPPNEFADEQTIGPYKQWVHRHSFTEIDAGTTLIDDEVRYRLPLEPFGDIVHVFVERELTNIFAHRQKTVEDLFSAGTPPPP